MIQNTNYGASKTYVNTKVDKLTTLGLKAYTHDGATQGDIAISNTYTSSTLALRDSNGRLVAADPAAGATDKTLTTANWVSQTGDSAPNNLVHKSGNETIAGIKTFRSITSGLVEANTLGHKNTGSSTTNAWRVLAKSTVTGNGSVRATFLMLTNQANRLAFGQMLLRTNGAPSVAIWLEKSFNPNGIAINYDTNTGECLFLVKTFYSYQAPRFIPIYTQRNDGMNIDALDYSDNTQYASEAEFPHPNTVYATYVGTDTP